MKIKNTKIYIFILIILFSNNTYSQITKINNNISPIIVNNYFENGLPKEIFVNSSNKESKWGYGYWENEYGFANIGFSQAGPDLILKSLSLSAKKVLKDWGFSKSEYQLGKKNLIKVQVVEQTLD